MAQHKLVIAEKPSVAQSLAAVIGATVRKDGYLEGNGWRVSWCVGHLAGLADADSYDPKYAKCGNRIRVKYTAKWGVQIAGMIFQTRSSIACHYICKWLDRNK